MDTIGLYIFPCEYWFTEKGDEDHKLHTAALCRECADMFYCKIWFADTRDYPCAICGKTVEEIEEQQEEVNNLDVWY